MDPLTSLLAAALHDLYCSGSGTGIPHAPDIHRVEAAVLADAVRPWVDAQVQEARDARAR